MNCGKKKKDHYKIRYRTLPAWILAGILLVCAALETCSAVKLSAGEVSGGDSAQFARDASETLEESNSCGSSGENTSLSSSGPDETELPESDAGDGKSSELIEDAEPPLTIDWDEMRKTNPRIIGYLYIDMMPQISYPICYSGDNEYYLHHNYRNKQEFSGAIFADGLNLPDFCDPNTLLYGHNMADGSMFGSLKFMDSQEKYDADPYFWILTPKGSYRYHIFSMFFTQVNSDAYILYGSGGSDFLKWEKLMQKSSDVRNDVPLGPMDKVVYLSTCTADSSKRFLVFGKCVSSQKPKQLYDRWTGKHYGDSSPVEAETPSTEEYDVSSGLNEFGLHQSSPYS